MSASRPQGAFQTTRKPFKWLGQPRFPAHDCLGSGWESCLAKSCPSESRAWPPPAQEQEETGNLLVRVGTRPPRAQLLRTPNLRPSQGQAPAHQDFGHGAALLGAPYRD